MTPMPLEGQQNRVTLVDISQSHKRQARPRPECLTGQPDVWRAYSRHYMEEQIQRHILSVAGSHVRLSHTHPFNAHIPRDNTVNQLQL